MLTEKDLYELRAERHADYLYEADTAPVLTIDTYGLGVFVDNYLNAARSLSAVRSNHRLLRETLSMVDIGAITSALLEKINADAKYIRDMGGLLLIGGAA